MSVGELSHILTWDENDILCTVVSSWWAYFAAAQASLLVITFRCTPGWNTERLTRYGSYAIRSSVLPRRPYATKRLTSGRLDVGAGKLLMAIYDDIHCSGWEYAFVKNLFFFFFMSCSRMGMLHGDKVRLFTFFAKQENVMIPE